MKKCELIKKRLEIASKLYTLSKKLKSKFNPLYYIDLIWLALNITNRDKLEKFFDCEGFSIEDKEKAEKIFAGHGILIEK
jgi:hypothetical protein